MTWKSATAGSFVSLLAILLVFGAIWIWSIAPISGDLTMIFGAAGLLFPVGLLVFGLMVMATAVLVGWVAYNIFIGNY